MQLAGQPIIILKDGVERTRGQEAQRSNIAAAKAIAGLVSPRELNEEYITPSMFDARVAPMVAAAVAEAAYKTGAARRRRKPVGGFRPV